jgi:hypothetical protein
VAPTCSRGAVCNVAPPEPTCQAVFFDICGSAHQPASIHEADINALGAAGVTSGCDTVKMFYCPVSPVTRGQMATFLYRAMQ